MGARATLQGKRAEARELYDSGLGCNAIARKLGVDPATVSRWAKEEHLRFDRSQTAMAVRAHAIDLAAARTELAQKMVVAASDGLDQLDEPYLVYSFGGEFNEFSSHVLDDAPAEVRRQMVTTAGIAFDKVSKVLETTPEGLKAAESLIDRLEVGLNRFDDAGDDDLAE